MKEIWPQLRERWKGALKRYQYVLLVMAAGVLLMMLPMGPSGGSEEAQGPPEGEGQFDLELFEEKLSQVLSDIQGAGKTRVVLTLKSGDRPGAGSPSPAAAPTTWPRTWRGTGSDPPPPPSRWDRGRGRRGWCPSTL